MIQFELAEITTEDNIVHQGIAAIPEKPGKKAVLWVHGLAGKFYSNVPLLTVLADSLVKEGIGFASFNTRGHDMVTGLTTVDGNEPSGTGHLTGGAGYEQFEDCVFDIAAGVKFLHDRGFTEVIVAGHSSGANKVCYFAAQTKDPIAGVVLAGPLSDRYSPHVDKDEYEKNITMLKMLRDDNKGDSLLTKVSWFPMTADRAWSLIAPNTSEDVFNYGDSEHVLETFASIRIPTLVVFSGNDEYADRPVEDIKNVFDQKTGSKNYSSLVIPGTTHGYEGKEQEFVDRLLAWVQTLP